MAKKKNKEVTTEGRQSLTDALTQAQIALKADGGALRATADVAEFNKKLIYTGLLEIDLICRLGFQSHIQLLGNESTGKTLLCIILARSAQRTCRQCYTPIIEFVNDRTGEVKTTCRCGKNDGMVVVWFDFAREFDSAWATAWGMLLGDPDIDKYTEVIPGVKLAPNSKFVIVRLENLDQTSTVVQHLMSDGAADFVVIDDLMSLASRESMEGKKQPGTKARAVSNLVSAINSAAAACWVKHRTSPTIAFPNQYRNKIGMSGGPMADPREAAGGFAGKYFTFQTLHLNTAYAAEGGGFKGEKAYGDTTAKVKKDKFSGSSGAEAHYRVYLKPTSVNRVDYITGDTDEGSRLWDIVAELGEGGLGDKRWFYKDNKGYHVLGRTFTSAKDIKIFLSRPDIGFMLRLPIFALRLSPEMRKHLNVDMFNYCPWKDEPILELINEAAQRIGTNVVSTRDDTGSTGADEEVSEDSGGEDPLAELGITFDDGAESGDEPVTIEEE
jgi:RecA/RadA recombinase